MTLRVFVLDDDPTRHNLFREWLFDAKGVDFDLTATWTAGEAIRQLDTAPEPFHLIFLDHDLGGQAYVESGPGTGQEVADWLAGQFVRFVALGPTPKVVVHSWNPDGGKRMFDTLSDAGFDVDRAWFGPSLRGYFL